MGDNEDSFPYQTRRGTPPEAYEAARKAAHWYTRPGNFKSNDKSRRKASLPGAIGRPPRERERLFTRMTAAERRAALAEFFLEQIRERSFFGRRDWPVEKVIALATTPRIARMAHDVPGILQLFGGEMTLLWKLRDMGFDSTSADPSIDRAFALPRPITQRVLTRWRNNWSIGAVWLEILRRLYAIENNGDELPLDNFRLAQEDEVVRAETRAKQAQAKREKNKIDCAARYRRNHEARKAQSREHMRRLRARRRAERGQNTGG